MINRFLIFFFILSFQQLLAETKPKMTKELCEVLGILGEYNGRKISYAHTTELDSVVEIFYSSEKELALKFNELIQTYAIKTNQKFPLTKKIGKQGHIYLYSKKLRTMLHSLYTIEHSNRDVELGTLNGTVILNQSDDFKYEYLKGVYRRFGNGNQISIANGISKLKTVYAVMKSLNIMDLKLYKTIEDYVPCDCILTFQRTNELQKRLSLNQTELKINNKMYKEIKQKN